MPKEHILLSDIVADNIRKLRMISGLSQTELAAKSLIDQSHISRVEGKKGRNVTLEVLDKIAKALEVSTYELLLPDNVDEYTLRDKVLQINSLSLLKKQMIEEMITAFLKESKSS